MAANNDSGFAWLTIVAAAGLFYIFAPASWTNAIWYGTAYKVNFGDVLTLPKPNDCDFMHAPLGDKGCHYKAVVGAFNANNVKIGGDNAPKYAKDTATEKPIVSYDNGKTWILARELANPDPKITSVQVSWEKVTD